MKRILLILVLCATAAGLLACNPAASAPYGALPTPLVTFAPGYLPTAQSAQANAQGTIAAGAAQMAQLAPQLTAAVATDARAGQLTATAQWESQSAATAQAAQTQAADATATAAAARNATATQFATETQVAGTAVAITMTQSAVQTLTAAPPAATHTQAALNEVVRRDRQREWESALNLGVTVFWFVFLPVVTVLVVIGLGYGYWKLLPALNIWLRKHKENGQTYFTAGDGETLDVLIPERSFGAGLRRTPDGIQTQAVAPDAALQAQVDHMTALTNIARALGPGRARAVRRLIKPTIQINGPQPGQGQPGGDVVEGQYRVVEPAEMRGWLDEIKLKLLQSGEREGKAGEAL